MFRTKTHKKSCKGLLSVLLMLSIMLSLYVPFSLTANAAQDEQLAAVGDEEPTEAPTEAGEEVTPIYAFLNYIDASKTGSNKAKYNLELVFKTRNVRDANYYAGPYTDFAEVEYVATTYTNDGNGRPSRTWNYNQWSPGSTNSSDRLPWFNNTSTASDYTKNGDYIRKVTFADKISPRSIAGWFTKNVYYGGCLCSFNQAKGLAQEEALAAAQAAAQAAEQESEASTESP